MEPWSTSIHKTHRILRGFVVSEQPLLYMVCVRSVGVYSGIMYGCVRYVLRVARVDSGWGVQILFLLHLDLVSSSCRCTAVMAPNYVVMYATVWVLFRICRPQEEPLSAGKVRVTPAASATTKGDIYVPGTYTKFSFSFSV